MTKEQFKNFKTKQNELYDKYADSKEQKAYELLNKEWEEFIKEFSQKISTL